MVKPFKGSVYIMNRLLKVLIKANGKTDQLKI